MPPLAGVVDPRFHVTTFGPLPAGAESTLAEVASGHSVPSVAAGLGESALAVKVYSPRSPSVQSQTKFSGTAAVTVVLAGGRRVQSAAPPLTPRSDGETAVTVPVLTLTLSVTV